jgi:4-amino-4-deoxy-L-arabinose transferase-like glycosyltransferase
MRNNSNAILFTLAALKFALPFLLQHGAYELHRDEYLYYAQGQHLDFGFLENPPLIGLLGYISSMFGGSPFWIKFWPALFGAATLLITARMAKELGGGAFAQTVAALSILFSAYLRIHFLFQPNFLEIFFWTLAAYYLIRYINTGQNKSIYFFSLALSLGWWSKYSVLFFAAAFFIALLLSPQRKMLAAKHFWLAVVLGVIAILPNIIWQYAHNWPLAHHMAELRETQLQYNNKSDFLKEQVLMLFPVLFVWLGGLFWLLRQPRCRIIAFIYLGVILLLMLGSGKGYYALGAYPMLLAAGGVWIERMGVLKSWVRYAAVGVILLLATPFVPLLLPMQPPHQMAKSNKAWGIEKLGLLKWEDQQNHLLQQDFADMLGWKELTQKAEAVFNSLPTFSKPHTWIICGSYGHAGALQYYAQQANFKKRVITGNGSFLLWMPQPLQFENIIFIDNEPPENLLFQHFEKASVMDSVTNPFSRQYGDKIMLYQHAQPEAIRIANESVKKMKATFTR